MQHIEIPYHEAGILARLSAPDESVLSRAAADGILALNFSPKDKERMHTLIGKAQAGTLVPDEYAEVEAYSRISSLLGILKSKARRALKNCGVKDKAKSR